MSADKHIGHIAKLTHNIGEGALVNGIRTTLVDVAKQPLSFLDIDRKDFQSISGSEFLAESVSKRLDGLLVRELNSTIDGLIIGGGGIIQTGRYENLGGLCLAGDIKGFSKLNIPTFLYALGDNRLKSEYRFEYITELEKLVQIITDRGGLCSLRNDKSFERLSELTNSSKFLDAFTVVPDPGLFVQVSKEKHPLISVDKVNIVLQLAGDRFSERLTVNGETVHDKEFLESIAQTIYRLSKAYDINVILAPHIPADLDTTAKFCDISDAYVIGNSSMTRELFSVNAMQKGYMSAPNFFSVYDQCDLAIGMRGHAAICSVGLNTPFISINTHEKVSGFMDSMQLASYGLNVADKYFSENLFKLCEELILDSGTWRLQRSSAYEHQKKINQNFNMEIYARL